MIVGMNSLLLEQNFCDFGFHDPSTLLRGSSCCPCGHLLNCCDKALEPIPLEVFRIEAHSRQVKPQRICAVVAVLPHRNPKPDNTLLRPSINALEWQGTGFVRCKNLEADRLSGSPKPREQPTLVEVALDRIRKRAGQIGNDPGSHVEKRLMMDTMARLDQRWNHHAA
jgi:hypothetical protein